MTRITKMAWQSHLGWLLLLVTGPAAVGDVSVWRSSEDGRWKLTQGHDLAFTPDSQESTGTPVVVHPETQFQSVLGMGSSFDHASCFNLSRLDDPTRQRVLRLLFDPVEGIGMNLMRLCMGTSDFSGEPWYTYADRPPGETDVALQHFSIERDRAYVLPIIKQALRINPQLKFFASPWSPPAWMKTNGSLLAGRIDRQYFEVYARYFVKFIQAYEAEGIPIYAVTLQNEPDYPNRKYPTCFWSAEEQRDFIRDHVGPQFEAEEIATRIWCWDHNWNKLEFPRTILSDPAAARFVAGTAFHLYEGRPEAQTQLQREFPQKAIYFSEGATFKTPGATQIIRILQNGARSYNSWVFMLDEHRKPNNGPHDASATPIELLDERMIRVNFDYYMYGHFMKFIEREARRIDLELEDTHLSGVAFQNPSGEIVLVIANASGQDALFRVRMHERQFRDSLPPRSLATYRWAAN